jgi:hypothetical protein
MNENELNCFVRLIAELSNVQSKKNQNFILYQDFHTFSQQPHQHGMSILQGLGSPGHRNGLRFVGCAYTAISRKGQGAFFAQSLSWGLFPVSTLVFSKIVCEVYRCI